MINKKIIMFVGMVLLVAGVVYASGVVFFGGNAYEDSDDKLVLDIDLSEANYDSGTKTFTDDSGEGNDGVSLNVASFTPDKYGMSTGAMSFNGVDDWVNISSGLSSISGNVTTFSAWMKLRTYDTYGCVLGHTNSGNSVYWQIHSDTRVYLSTNSITVTSTDFDDDTWRHVVFVSDGINSVFYVNGVQKGGDNGAVTSLGTGAKNFIIGTSVGNAPNWRCNGSISEVKIYNRSLSATEVMALYNSSKPKASAGSSQSGLVGHWALDSGGYNSNTESITDKTPYGNHGTNVGAILTTDRMGHENKSMSFDGSDYINCGDVIDLGETTVTFWFKTSDLTAHNGIIDFAGSAGLGHFDFNHYLDRPLLYFANSNYRYFNSNFQDYLDGNWHFLVLYIKGGQIDDILSSALSVDLNSISVVSTSHSVSPDSWNDLHIGKTGYGSFNGSISDVRIYNRALSVDEINALYNSYRPKAGSGSLKRGLILDMPLKLKYTKDETVGSEIMTDRTPYSNDGQNNGASVGGGYSSFVPNDYVDCSNASSLQITNNISVFMWIKGGTPDHGDSIISRWDTGANKRVWDIFGTDTNLFGIQLSDDGTFSAGHRKQYLSSNVVYDNNWHQIGFTFNTVDLKLYVDGIESTGIANFNDSITFLDSNNIKLMMGANLNNGALQRYSQINLCDVKIYNRALLESEIKLLYDKGR